MHPLDAIQVRSPCEEPWRSMTGDSRVRFCGRCRKHVYDLSRMSRAEAEAFVATRDEACVRFVRRADGTVATSECRSLVGADARAVVASAVLVALGALGGLGAARVHDVRPWRDLPSPTELAWRVRWAIADTWVERVLERAHLLKPLPRFVGAVGN